MGKKKTTQKSNTTQQATSTQTVAPTAQYQPYINAGADALKPGFEAAQQQVNSLLPRLNEGMDYYGDVMDGKYLNANPYLEGMIGDTNRSIMDSVTGEFSDASRYGSGYHTKTLADRVAANENNIRGAEYGRERGFMNDAPGRIAALAPISAALPQAPGSAYAQALAALLGRYNTANSSGTQTGSGTTTTTQSGGLLDSLLQAGSAAAFAFSDPRLKKNVKKIGERPDGLGVYEYEYRRDRNPLPRGKQIGVMADEVAEKRPDAAGPIINRFMTVNYGAL